MKTSFLLQVAVCLALAFLVLAGLLIDPQRAAAGGGLFEVNSTGDGHDNNIGDCLCETAGGYCTLRAAIEEANACTGAQTIRFNAPMRIQPTSNLPTLTDDDTIIDGSDQWTTENDYEIPGVILDGDYQPYYGLVIQGSNCAVRGIMIIMFARNGILVQGGAQYVTIGGSGTHQRNVVSLNAWNGIYIHGASTTSNTVAGNYVGTYPTGVASTSDWSNGYHGISVWDGGGNQVSNNLVANNGWSGITIDNVPNGEIALNHIGMDINGQPLGNAYYGIHASNGAQDVNVSYNAIGFNQRGIHVDGDSDLDIEYNTIYSNTAGDLNGGGVMVTGSSQATIQYNHILSNTATSGGGIAVEGNAFSYIYSNTIQANHAYTTTSSVSFGGGGIYAYQPTGAWVYANQILNNTATGAPSSHPFPDGGGIYFNDVPSGIISTNEIRGNLVQGNAGGGGGIYAKHGDYLAIFGNRIVDNETYTWSHDGSGIHLLHNSTSYEAMVSSNWVSGNRGANGAIYTFNSQNVSFENNVIVDNHDSGVYIQNSSGPITVTNNTIAQNEDDGIVVHDADLALVNTIVASNSGYGIQFAGVSTGISRNTNNDVWDNSGGASNQAVSFYLTQDPLFMDAAADRYGLRAGSPCLDTAYALYAPSNSYNGLSRPQGNGPDIGAYEMAPPLYLPLVMRNS